ALGVRLLDAAGRDLPDGGGALVDLDRIEAGGADRRLRDCRFDVAVDVRSPLLGLAGAAAVFAPQKGGSPAQVQLLETGLARPDAASRPPLRRPGRRRRRPAAPALRRGRLLRRGPRGGGVDAPHRRASGAGNHLRYPEVDPLTDATAAEGRASPKGEPPRFI